SVDLPLSNECKRVLAYAAEEAERLSHKHIGTEHLLLGLLREEKCFAAEILHERGLRLSTIREELARSSQEKSQPQRQRESSLLRLWACVRRSRGACSLRVLRRRNSYESRLRSAADASAEERSAGHGCSYPPPRSCETGGSGTAWSHGRRASASTTRVPPG